MIYVFGSCNVDMVFQLEALPLPGETVLCPEYNLFMGGKGANQAVAVAKAGGAVMMVGCVGKQKHGALMQESLNAAGVLTDYLKKTSLHTGCAVIGVNAKGENSIIVASGANRCLKASDFPWERLTKDDVVLLQMETVAEENWCVIKEAHRLGARVILNLAPAKAIPQEILKSVDVLILNEHELQTLIRGQSTEDKDAAAAVTYLAKTFSMDVIVTQGAQGVIFATAPNPADITHIPAYAVTAVDTTGAGDTFFGYFAEAYATRRAGVFPDGIKRAMAAGALACTKPGAQASIPEAKQVDDFMKYQGC